MATPLKLPVSVPLSRMVCGSSVHMRMPPLVPGTSKPLATNMPSCQDQSRKGPQKLRSYCTLSTGACASLSTSLPRYLTFFRSMPEALRPDDAAGRMQVKRQNSCPPREMTTSNWPAVPLLVVGCPALLGPQFAVPTLDVGGAPPSYCTTDWRI